jgi:membrane-associated phospholipid phosphatase
MNKFVALLLMICPLSAQVEPNAGKWKTWVISSGSAMRLPAPPASDVTATELQWVRECVNQRDQATLNTIRYWDAGSPAYRWMQLAQQYVVNSNLAGPQQTRALALVAAAISDATIAAWDSKYAYNRPHPSSLDPAIAPVTAVPQSPSYPSEHGAAAGAAATVLSYLFPDQAARLSDLAYQAAISRVIAGVAFPSDALSGVDLGEQVGRAVVAYAAGRIESTIHRVVSRRCRSLVQPESCDAACRFVEALGARHGQGVPSSLPAAVGLGRCQFSICTGQKSDSHQCDQSPGMVLAAWIFPIVASASGS